MTFQEALNILNHRRQIEEEADDPHTGANLVLAAAHLVVTEVAAVAETNTDGLGDWIESGDYTGTETPESIAVEWDSYAG